MFFGSQLINTIELDIGTPKHLLDYNISIVGELPKCKAKVVECRQCLKLKLKYIKLLILCILASAIGLHFAKSPCVEKQGANLK